MRTAHINSLEAYRNPKNKIGRDIQEKKIIEWLRSNPFKSCRQIEAGTGIELSSVRRACHNLEYPKYGNSIVNVYDAVCKIKNTTVKHFEIKNSQLNIF